MNMAERLIKERLIRGQFPGREFDVDFWQALGPGRIFEAARDLVVTAAAVRGINEDQLRLQRSVEKSRGARYLIVGGYAVMVYTEPRYTKDLDIWVEPSAVNSVAVFQALRTFGAPLTGMQPGDFAEPAVFLSDWCRPGPNRYSHHHFSSGFRRCLGTPSAGPIR